MSPDWTRKRLAWIEAFDWISLTAILQTMRGLDLFWGVVARVLLFDSPSQQTFRNPGASRVRKRRAAVKKGSKRQADQPAPLMGRTTSGQVKCLPLPSLISRNRSSGYGCGTEFYFDKS
jgi:hypothetical protein